MSRVSIDFPESCIFSTEIKVHATYINRGNHVGNSSYVQLCNETSLQFFSSRNVPEYCVGEQVLLNTDFSVQLKAQARYADVLTVDLGVDNFHRCGCDFIFRFLQRDSGALVALAAFSFLTFDYQQGKVVSAADDFHAFFKPATV